jgi:hypothetical protein
MAITRLNNNSITSITALPSGVGGKIGNVSTVDLTSTYVTASSSLTSSGISVSITPSATTSKVLLILSCNMYINTDGYGFLAFYRGTTNLADSGYGHFQMNEPDNYYMNTVSHIDSPSSTSALTYNIYFAKTGTNNFYLNPSSQANNDGAEGSFVAMEILA